MLNITSRITLTKKTKKSIKQYLKQNHGVLDATTWSKINRRIKNEISKRLFANQGYKCVYCSRYLTGLGPEIDHFANKATYPQFTFTLVNLFYSCNFCNSPEIKGSKPTIDNINPHYNLCTFKIIHPYYDNFENEVQYQDADKIYFDLNNCTQKAKDTISFFHFDELFMTSIKSRNLLYERLNPLTSDQEKELIMKSISYR